MISALLNTVALALYAQPGHGEAATAAHQATEGAHAAAGNIEPAGVLPTMSQGIVPAIVSLVVFVAVFAVLSVMVWPKITKALDERADKIKGEIDAAEAARAQAKKSLEEYEKNLAQAHAEAQKMIADAKAIQQAQLAEMKAKADAELAAMKSKAIGEIDAAKKAALAELYTHTATLSTAVAAKILQREVNAADQGRFVTEALAGMKN